MRLWIASAAMASLGLALLGLATMSEDQPAALSDVRKLALSAGLSDGWPDFFALVAEGESRNNPAAVNDDARERRKALEGFVRNADRFAPCGRGASAYSWGSGGLFGFLPSTAFSQFSPGRGRCLDPRTIFDPRVSLAAGIGYARGLMGWSGYRARPDVLNLRAMWGWPAKGGDASYLAERRPVYMEAAKRAGIHPGFLDTSLPQLSITADEALERLGVST